MYPGWLSVKAYGSSDPKCGLPAGSMKKRTYLEMPGEDSSGIKEATVVIFKYLL